MQCHGCLLFSKFIRIDAKVSQHGGQKPLAYFLAAILQRGTALAKVDGAMAVLATPCGKFGNNASAFALAAEALQKLIPIHGGQLRTNLYEILDCS